MSDVKSAAAAHMTKADRALAAAQLLLSTADTDGACNRAYYAMFDAAFAALLCVTNDPENINVKTHSGLIGAFGNLLVRSGHVDAELGRTLNKVKDIRLLADYRSDPVSIEDATWAVEHAKAFVDTIRSTFLEKPSTRPAPDL